MMENRRYLVWLRDLSLNDAAIILRYSFSGWRACIKDGEFTLYGANADNPTDAVSTLYLSRERTADAVERALRENSWPLDAGL